MVMLPLLLIVVGIVQFGLLLSANVTLTNAAREGARAGSIYDYKPPLGAAGNDLERCRIVAAAVTQSLETLRVGSPNFTTTNPCTGSGNLWTSGDVTIEYAQGSAPTADSRDAYNMTVRVTYRQEIIVPLLGAFLSTDGSGRFVHQTRVTMVVN